MMGAGGLMGGAGNGLDGGGPSHSGLSGRGRTRALVSSLVDKEIAREVAAMRQLLRRQEALLPALAQRHLL